jgi:hypothetical protein
VLKSVTQHSAVWSGDKLLVLCESKMVSPNNFVGNRMIYGKCVSLLSTLQRKTWQWKCVTHLKTEDLDNKVRWMNAEYSETCLEHNTKGSGHFSASDLLLFSKVPFLLGERPCTVRSTLWTGSATQALINTALLLSGILFNLLLCFFFLFHLRGMFKCYAHIRNLLKARIKPFLFTL